MTATPRPRAERLAVIRLGLAAGLTHKQIAASMGVSRSTVKNLIYDPDGTKQAARRERYRGTCEDCGTVTMSNGTSRPNARCSACAAARTKVWTRGAILHAIRSWAATHGGPPSATDWIRSGADHPASSNVYGPSGSFPSWANAIEAAGFLRPVPGVYAKRRRVIVCEDCGVTFEHQVRANAPRRCPACAHEHRNAYFRARYHRAKVTA